MRTCNRLVNVEDQTISKQFSCTRNSDVWARSCISPCGQFVVAGADDGTAHAWDSLTGKKLHHYTDLSLQGALSDIAFHPHDNLIAFASFGSSQSVVVARHVPGSQEYVTLCVVATNPPNQLCFNLFFLSSF